MYIVLLYSKTVFRHFSHMENQPLFKAELNRYYLNSHFNIENLNRHSLFATLKYALWLFSTLTVLHYETRIDNLKYKIILVTNPYEN